MKTEPKHTTKSPAICIIGAGKMAYNLCHAFNSSGLSNICVINRNHTHLKELSTRINIKHLSTDYKDIPKDTSLLLIAVSDDAIPLVAEKIQPYVPHSSVVTHCSGVLPITILQNFDAFGLFYPLASMSKEKFTNFQQIPIIIDGNAQNSIQFLQTVAAKLSPKVYRLNDGQRPFLHLAAVLVNNFTTHIIGTAFDLLQEHQISKDLLSPIIKQTLENVLKFLPHEIQSGPAIRLDLQTLDKHLELLDPSPTLHSIYILITKSVIKTQMERKDFTKQEREKAESILSQLK